MPGEAGNSHAPDKQTKGMLGKQSRDTTGISNEDLTLTGKGSLRKDI